MCTDAPAHPLGKFPFATCGQSAEMPASLEELESIWGDEVEEGEMEYAAKRLLVFAPTGYPWSEISERLENCVWFAAAAGQGLQEADQDTVLEQITGSV